MQQPVCGLCRRMGCTCMFPLKRKTPELRKQAGKESQATHRKKLGKIKSLRDFWYLKTDSDVDRLINILETWLEKDDGLDQVLNMATEQDCTESSSREMNRPAVQPTSPNYAPSSETDSRPTHCSSESHSTIQLSGDDDDVVCLGHMDPLPVAYSLDILKNVADELVHIYFDKVQAWVPLFNRPKFYARYMNGVDGGLTTVEGYSLEDAFIFYSIFSLSARYSSSSFFGTTPPLGRGENFATCAIDLYDKSRRALEPATVPYLQGCILLAYYLYTSGPCPRSWTLTGVCVRMAYELELNNIDESEPDLLDAESWSQKEGLRRVWWLIWELDAFGSSISRRPYFIHSRKMKVHLPVSDKSWFANTPVRSAPLRAKPAVAWKSLCDCPNQSARAWFLVSNYLMTLPHDMAQDVDGVSERERQELENSITCFGLSLPHAFSLDTNSAFVDYGSFSDGNWIISTHLMLLAARSSLASLYATAAAKQQTGLANTTGVFRSTQRLQELSRIIHHWPPEYISLCHPFIACTLIPLPQDLSGYRQLESETQIEQDMITLVLSHYALVWGLGSIALRLQKLMQRLFWYGETLLDDDIELSKRYAVFFYAAKTQPSSSPLQSIIDQKSTLPAMENSVLSGSQFYCVDDQIAPLPLAQFPNESELMGAPLELATPVQTGHIHQELHEQISAPLAPPLEDNLPQESQFFTIFNSII
ncbi:hypothetical protein K469DRAFT_687228 [Zopfia rhizophila CBS 207.26]|uniref:Xylanolytic transcriptional activator regulatory domain-containing protein n=1 Tax=Zopfia rhizophila CBS 207.26 TaxID=1314779 RepID=A0A6A6E500_9PEZI|nr:hypothetical protein K469DRAFT_687228 [Zopfia rhizophila CBS 207.26]